MTTLIIFFYFRFKPGNLPENMLKHLVAFLQQTDSFAADPKLVNLREFENDAKLGHKNFRNGRVSRPRGRHCSLQGGLNSGFSPDGLRFASARVSAGRLPVKHVAGIKQIVAGGFTPPSDRVAS